MQALVAEDHLRAALFATAQQHAKDTLIDDDHRQASLKATTKQYEMEAAAAAHGMYVDQYLRNVNQFPTMVCYIGPKPGLAPRTALLLTCLSLALGRSELSWTTHWQHGRRQRTNAISRPRPRPWECGLTSTSCTPRLSDVGASVSKPHMASIIVFAVRPSCVPLSPAVRIKRTQGSCGHRNNVVVS